GVLQTGFAANITWQSSPATSFWNAANWNSNGASVTPNPGDALVFDASNTTALSNDFASGTAFNGLTFTAAASGYTLSGNKILLSGNLAGVTNGVTNSSSSAQTVGLNLDLDWGVHTFTSATTTLALNGAMTAYAPAANPILRGGAAYFGSSNITS